MPTDVLLVFMLTTFIDGEPQPDVSYWYSIDRCMYFARSLRRQNAWLSHKYNQTDIVIENLALGSQSKVVKITEFDESVK